ncbi:MAG: bacteriocin [Colwellia sp.]|nr:bacteriocin [Colwellia sp.]
MRELNVNEIEQINGAGKCEAYASLTKHFFSTGGGLVGMAAFGGVGGLAGAALGGMVGDWAASVVLEDCAQ